MFFTRFLKRKTEGKAPLNMQDTLVYRVVLRCLSYQMKGAVYMQKWSGRLSISVKKWLLVLFCLLAGGYSLYTTLDHLNNHQKKVFTIPVIEMPQNIGKAGEEKKSTRIIITKEERDRIRSFQRYLDSLGKTTEGKKQRDSLLRFRPGLLDSLRLWEQRFTIQSP